MAKLLGGTIVYGTGTVQTILYVQGTTSSTSTASGALQVVGGAGIGGNLYVGGTIYGTFSGSVTGAATSATNIIGGSAGSIPIQSSPGVTTFINTGSVGNLLQQRVGNTATFVSTSTLQVGYSSNVAGGTAGQLVYQSAPNSTGFVNTGSVGQLLMSSGTSAPLYVNTSSIYVGYAVYANTATNISGGSTGSVVYQSATGTTAMLTLSTAGYVLTAGTSGPQWSPVSAIQSNTATNISGGTAGQIVYQTGPGQTSFVSTSTAGYVLTSNGTGSPVYQNTLTLTGTTAAISTNSGALQVAGGAGLGGDLYLGGNFIQVGNTHGTLATTYNLINTTATTVNFAGAGTTVSIGAASGTTTVKNNLTVVGNLTIQGTTTIVDSTVTNIADPIIMLGGGASDAAPSVDDNKDRGIAFKWFSGGAARTGFFGYQDSTGFFTFISSATITNEVVAAAGGSTKGALDAYLAGGTAQSLVYQSSPNVTSFLAAGTSGFILQTNGTGSAPSWVSASGVAAGSATTATNADNLKTIATTANSSHYISFVDSNNTVAGYEAHYTTSSFFINPATKTLVVDSGSTTNPGAQIIVGPSSGSAAVGDKVVIGFKLQNTVGGGTGNSFAAGVGGVQDQASNNGGALAFYTQFSAGDGTPERMRITNAGNVGIGTTAPTGASGLALAINGGTNQTRIALKNSTTGDAAGDGFQIVLDASGVDVALEQRENGAIRFNTNNTERMRIDASGTVLIGAFTTSIARKFTVVGEGNFADASNNTRLYMGFGTIPTTGGSGSYVFNADNSPLVFGTTNTERMRITALGGISFGATGTAYGTSGYILKSNGDAAPTWVDPATVAAASATNADNLKTVLTSTNATYYPSFVDSNNAAAAYEAYYTTSSFSINPGTGVVTLSSTAAASSTITGALRVTGGVGIGGTLYVGSLRADATTSATTFGIFYNPTTKELTTATSGLAAGTATTSSQLQTVGTATNATYFPTFVDSNNSSLIGESIFTTSTFQINPYTGNVGISAPPITTATYRLNVANIIQVGGQGGQDVTQIGGGGGTGSFIRGYYGTDGTQAFNITGNGDSYVNASTAAGNFGIGNRSPQFKLDVGPVTAAQSATVGASGLIRNAAGADTSPFTQARIVVYGGTGVDTANWGYFGYGSDASLRIVYGKTGAGAPLIFGTTSAMDGSGTLTTRMALTMAGALAFGSTTAYGTAGQILQSNGDAAPTWVSTGSLTAGIATTSSQLQTVGIATNASYYPSFVDSNNATAIGELYYTTSTFSINPSTGVVSLTSTAAATSTTTGALRVTGGVGIQGDLYAKDIYTNGVKAIPLNIQEFTATAAQTTFTVTGGYTVGTVQVFANGINLGSGDFTASNGTTVVVGQARNAGDIIRIISGGVSSSINNIQSFSIAMSVAMAM